MDIGYLEDLYENDRMRTSWGRYQHRVEQFSNDGLPYPKLRHDAHWFLHNVIVHPLVGLAPGKITTRLHDISSKWLNHGQGRASEIPEVHDKATWGHHNIVAHILIGLLPSEWAFEYHDETAEDMNVPGWV